LLVSLVCRNCCDKSDCWHKTFYSWPHLLLYLLCCSGCNKSACRHKISDLLPHLPCCNGCDTMHLALFSLQHVYQSPPTTLL
jgi:hypothetical protein